MTRVPFMNPASAYQELKTDIDAAIARVLDSGHYILGEEVNTFEATWAGFCGASHAIGVSDGLAALALSLKALDIEAGDEVIVPANTFIATWLAVTKCGAVPIPIDPDESSLNVTAEGIEAAITPRTRAILPVHLYGQPVDLDPIVALAGRHGVPVIEDAAQAHAARYKGRKVGNGGTLACWSFYPAKNLGAIGDAGAVTTSDDVLAERLRLLRNYGSSEKYIHVMQGENSRLDPLQAAILGAKLPHLEEWNKRRARIAARYLERLSGCPVVLPATNPDSTSSWHIFAIRTPHRDRLREHLRREGIDCLSHYPVPPHLQQAYASLGFGKGDFPISERAAAETLSLPIGPHMSLDDADRVCDSIVAFWSQGFSESANQ